MSQKPKDGSISFSFTPEMSQLTQMSMIQKASRFGHRCWQGQCEAYLIWGLMATLAMMDAACLWTSLTVLVRPDSTTGRAPAWMSQSTLFSSLERLNMQRSAWTRDSPWTAAEISARGSILLRNTSGLRLAKLANAAADLHFTLGDSDLQNSLLASDSYASACGAATSRELGLPTHPGINSLPEKHTVHMLMSSRGSLWQVDLSQRSPLLLSSIVG